MILLVTGGRHYGDVRPVDDMGRPVPPEILARRRDELAKLCAVLSALHADTPITLLIHGGSSGADYQAGQWARNNKVSFKALRANWNQYGKAAGPIRNQLMLDAEKPEMVLAFPGDRGTKDMVERAEAQGFHVIKIEQVYE